MFLFPAVDTVLNKVPIKMDGHILDIEMYNPLPEEPLPLCTIEVRGPSDTINSEMLELYFDNERRSGGGEITDIDRQENVAYVTFASEEGNPHF